MYEIKVAEIIIQQNIWFIHKGLKNMRKIQIKNSPIMVCRYIYTYKNTPQLLPITRNDLPKCNIVSSY